MVYDDGGKGRVMPAGGDLIELVHEQTYLGQLVNNVYFFEAIIADASLEDLATWFETNLVPDIKGVQNDAVIHVALRLRNIFNLAEVFEEPLTGTGVNVSGALELPSFVAASFRLDHDNAVVRPGYKRYCGLTETTITDALLASGPLLGLAAIAENLVNPPAIPNPDWAHVIVKRLCQQANPDPNGVPSCLKYRLPENQGEYDAGYPVSWEIQPQPTTQNSRKWYT